MYIPHQLSEQDNAALRAVVAFLENRLAEQDAIDWAVKLKASQVVERLAIEQVLNWSAKSVLPEPWSTAWRLIEESWSSPAEIGRRHDAFSVQKRLRNGERSGSVVAAIVQAVEPRLKVEPIDSWRWRFIKRPKHPKTVAHLISASLTSGELVDLTALKLEEIAEPNFLKALAESLEVAVNRGLEIGRRLGWDGRRSLWRLGSLNRVYYTQQAKRNGDQLEVDAYHEGIAPSTKLLHAVVSRIASIDQGSALSIVRRWRLESSPVHQRLWAAMARDPKLVSGAEVAAFLKEIDARSFWDLSSFPEVAELRAVRFLDLGQKSQIAIISRIDKGPPRSFWPKDADGEKVSDARLYWRVRELSRIEVGGGQLPGSTKAWLEDQRGRAPNLAARDLQDEFPEAAPVRGVPPNPDARFDTLEGVARLRALEASFSSSNGGWDDPASKANDWLRERGNPNEVLRDFEKAKNVLDQFPSVWSRFGWAHAPPPTGPDGRNSTRLQQDADRVLSLFVQLSSKTLATAIDGVAAWMDAWGPQVVASPVGWTLWFRVWPIAVEATNKNEESEEKEEFDTIDDAGQLADSQVGHKRLDTLNTPAGKLVGVFLHGCPSLKSDPSIWLRETTPRLARDLVIQAHGRSGLIVRHRLIEALPYFLNADREWARTYLVEPLLNDDSDALALWRAIGRQTQFTNVLRIIGTSMAERASDRRLSRETRRMLAFSLVVESLHAFREGRDTAVPNSRIQQMLRAIDDETRASSAHAVLQFVRELSGPQSDEESGAAKVQLDSSSLFHASVAPFLRSVWPQERSLVTPGVSKAFAELPAASGEAFVDAVDLLERFLAPFDCWSLVDYGLFGKEGEREKLSTIDTAAKALALLRLLDWTLSKADGAVVPYDLTDALDQIRSQDPAIAQSAEFRRLSTIARR